MIEKATFGRRIGKNEPHAPRAVIAPIVRAISYCVIAVTVLAVAVVKVLPALTTFASTSAPASNTLTEDEKWLLSQMDKLGPCTAAITGYEWPYIKNNIDVPGGTPNANACDETHFTSKLAATVKFTVSRGVERWQVTADVVSKGHIGDWLSTRVTEGPHYIATTR